MNTLIVQINVQFPPGFHSSSDLRVIIDLKYSKLFLSTFVFYSNLSDSECPGSSAPTSLSEIPVHGERVTWRAGVRGEKNGSQMT